MTDLIPFAGRRTLAPIGAAAVGFVAGVALLTGRKAGMQATTAIAGDWLRQLELEHRQAEFLFKLGSKTKEHQTVRRTAILGHLTYALLKHGLQEETVIYPALREAGVADEPSKLAAEHFEIKTYLHRLAETPRNDPRWIRDWNDFHELVAHHVREEEDEVFPGFHERMSSRQNLHLTLAMNREGVKLA